MTNENSKDLQELKESMFRMELTLEKSGDKQDEILADIKDVKSAIYHPESGLYTRIKSLEIWQRGISKFIWTAALSISGLVLNAIFKLI
tara:strand:- start:896 stop:1162 length:267 start_codon:yes stop_codon:yes gene_type:complete